MCLEKGHMKRMWCLEGERRKMGVGNVYKEKEM